MNFRLRPFSRRISPAIWMLVGIFVLSGCTIDDEVEPEATPSATAVSFGPDDVAVGTLLDDSRSAWDEVERWTSETRIESPGEGASVAASSVTSEQVVLPNDRRIVNMSGETMVSEEIFTNGTIYMRGTLVSASIYPDVDATTWISFTPDVVPPDTALDQRVSYLTSPPAFPFADVTDETRALPASPAGDIQVNGRVCAVYQFTTAESSDAGLDYRIAFDEDDRPCQLVRESGGVAETTTWSYGDADITITPPEEATPIETFPSGI